MQRQSFVLGQVAELQDHLFLIEGTMSTAYETITAKIITMIENGTCPWRMPWSQIEETQRNGVSKAGYRGINQIITSLTAYAAGYASPYWLTFRQAQETGGTVRKGEKGTPVIRYGEYTRENDDGEAVQAAFLKCYYVFNADQCDNIPDEIAKPAITGERSAVEKIDACESIIASYLGKPAIEHGGNRASYNPHLDLIRMPKQSQFACDQEYYNTLFHELAHSTGHASRLARSGVVDQVAFGSHQYSQEELVAEFTAAFLAQRAGIDSATIDNSAAYLASWLKVLKSDSKMLVVAAGQAQKAADFISKDLAESSPTSKQFTA